MTNAARPSLVIIAGPSGVGKTTVADRLIAASPVPIRRAITATTRAPRPGERPDVDYHFWTKDFFESQVKAGRMLEWAQVHGSDLYGTPRSEVEGKTGITLLVIDVQGAAQVRATGMPHTSIFLLPPSIEELTDRLTKRGEAPEKIARRLKTATEELTRAHEFDFRVENRDLAETVRITLGLINTP